MSLKRLFLIIFSLEIVLLTGLGFLALLIFQNEKSMETSRRNQIHCMKLVDELRQSSDDLTRLVRTYVATGEPAYEQMYWEVLAIRNGEKPRPVDYDRVYWDLVLAGDAARPRPGGEPAALEKRLAAAKFVPQELAKLQEAKDNSDGLVATEKRAMNAMKGKFTDEKTGNLVEREPDPSLAIRLVHSLEYHQYKARIMKPIGEMTDLFETRITAENERYARNARALLKWSMALVAVSVMLTVAAFLVVYRKVVSPLIALKKIAVRVAGGATDVEISASQPDDEVGAMATAFRATVGYMQEMSRTLNLLAMGDLRSAALVESHGPQDEMGNAEVGMVGNLQKMTREISEGASMLAAAVAEMSAAVAQLSSSTSESAASINVTASSLEEVRETARLTSQNADGVADNARKGGAMADEGRERVEDIARAMSLIRDRMDFIARHTLQLNERNQRIGEIIAAVNDIADQSNILAVNAAIEAAKAGEEGKGFVVLAQEIRSLAEQSKQSTREIRAILEEIQRATTSTVLATEEGTKAVAKGEEQAGLVREAILRLATSVASSAKAATVIAGSAREQLKGLEQVAEAMNNIRMAGEQDRKSAAQLKETTSSLNILGRRLVEAIGHFRN